MDRNLGGVLDFGKNERIRTWKDWKGLNNTSGENVVNEVKIAFTLSYTYYIYV